PFSVLRSSASTDICSLSLHDALPIWGSKTLRQSDADVVTVVAAGVTVFEALKAYETLARDGIAIRVIDAYSIQPIDKAGLVAAGKATGGRILTVEDHYSTGGLEIGRASWREREERTVV